MLQSLRDFRTASGPATIMHQLAKGYTDSSSRSWATISPRQAAASFGGMTHDIVRREFMKWMAASAALTRHRRMRDDRSGGGAGRVVVVGGGYGGATAAST